MKKTNLLASTAVAAALLATLAPATAQATYYHGHGQRPITVYFTRHAEKKTTTTVIDEALDTYELIYSGDEGDVQPKMAGEESKGDNLDEVCGVSKCAEELNALGLERAELLAGWFKRNGITRRLDAVYSSHKRRTFQTVDPTAVEAGLTVVQLPLDGTELEPEGTTDSECPTIAAIQGSNPGDTLLVAGHSGTLYDIMGAGNDDCEGLGLDISNDRRFPKDTGKNEGKVRDFGDIWKVVIYPNGQARFAYRVNLQPKRLFVDNYSY